MKADPKLSEIRKVALEWVDGGSTAYLIHVDDVPMFVEASKRLHFSPGVNPATGGKTRKIWAVTVQKLKPREPHWWTMPCLGDGSRKGARIIDGEIIGETRPFEDQEYVDRMNAEEDEMEDEYERRRYGR